MEQATGSAPTRVKPPLRIMHSTQVNTRHGHPVTVVHPPGATPAQPDRCPATCTRCYRGRPC